jgi:hypothetical protein
MMETYTEQFVHSTVTGSNVSIWLESVLNRLPHLPSMGTYRFEI